MGMGLSGAALALRLEKMGKDFVIFDDASQSSSKVAGGIMNPVILKRFSLAWKADSQLSFAKSFYKQQEKLLETTFLIPLDIFRKFSSVEEQNNWFEALDKPFLAPFLDEKLYSELNPAIPSEFSFGKVLQTAKLDTNAFLDKVSDHFILQNKLKRSRFEYADLKISAEAIKYNGITSKNVIFCEGFGIKKNPFFNYLPLYGNKGEYLIIKSPKLQFEVAVKASVFIIPLGNDFYQVGATYNNSDKSPAPTIAARKEILEKLDKMIIVNYEVVDQIAGIRPSTLDRRPLLGKHPKFDNIFCCNGFGSHGVMTAPSASEELLDFIEKGAALASEVNIERFTQKFWKG